MSGINILKINNDKEVAIKSGNWKNPGAKFYDKLLNSFYCEGDIPTDAKTLNNHIKDGKYLQWNDFIKEAYLIAPINDIKNSPYGVTPFSRSGCKYPHHVIKNGELVLSVPGVRAAYTRAKQQGVYSGELKAHLIRHMRELGDLVNFEEKIEANFNNIYNYINEKSGISLFDDIPENFMEKSHSNLKYEFRLVIGEKDGHLYKIVYNLNPDNIISDNISTGDARDDLRKNIRKTGHSNYTSSDNTVIAIVDMSTGKRVNEILAYPPIHNSGGSIEPYTIKKYIGVMKRFIKDDDKLKKLENDLRNECPTGIVPNPGFEQAIEDSKKQGQMPIKYKVGEVDNTVTYKTTDIKKVTKGMLGLESIQESLNWIENFVNDAECRDQYLSENNYQIMMSRNNPNELMIWMKANIRYGWRSMHDGKIHNTNIDDSKEFNMYYKLQHPTKLAESKFGIAWDQVELERKWFAKNGIEHGVFYIEIQGNIATPNHTFLVYKQGESYLWFEYAMSTVEGIRKYDNLKTLIIDVVHNFQNECNDYKSPVYVSWLQNPPPFNITCDEYISYAHSQKQLDVNNLPINLYESINESVFTEEISIDDENKNEDSEDEPPSLPGEENISSEEQPDEDDESEEEPPELEELQPEESEEIEEEETSDEEVKEEEPVKEEPKPESLPKQTDKAESNKNGVRRKKLYIAFIEWCKEYNPKNTFGSIFDKDAFKVSYPFVPEEMRYFYRLANPMLCVLAGDLTFFPVAELRKLNAKNSKLNEMLIFAATPNDLRVFSNKDKKVYRATEENGNIKLAEVLGNTFDTYIQKMINKGDILNAPIEESVEPPYIW